MTKQKNPASFQPVCAGFPKNLTVGPSEFPFLGFRFGAGNNCCCNGAKPVSSIKFLKLQKTLTTVKKTSSLYKIPSHTNEGR